VRFGASALLCAGTVGVLAVEQWRAAPVYSIYQNAIGERLARPAETFPEEAYDFGVREAVAAIAAEARPGAAIVSDVPMAVEYYLRRAGRGDLEARSLSGQGLRMSGEQWVLVQDSHTYFENAPVVVQLRQDGSPLQEYRLGGTPVLQVFRVDWYWRTRTGRPGTTACSGARPSRRPAPAACSWARWSSAAARSGCATSWGIWPAGRS
jgi:hypothetical protein